MKNSKETTMKKKKNKDIQQKLVKSPQISVLACRHKIPSRICLLIKRQGVASPMCEVEWVLARSGSACVASDS